MKIENIPDTKTFSEICAELAVQGVCFVANATNLTIELTGGH
jgi:hypothetical protein